MKVKFKFKIYIDWWDIIPTIEIHGQDYVYRKKNFSIQLHFMCFHWRWMFMEDPEQ